MYELAPVRLGEAIVEHVLGLLLDDNMNWKHHIANLCNSLSRTAGVLYRVRHKLTIESMLTLYYTLRY